MHQHPGFYNMDASYFQGVDPKETILESWVALKHYVNQILPAGGRQWHLSPNLSDSRPVLDALSEQQMPSITRQEVITKLLSTCFGLAVSFSITYFGIKWLVNAMDPTREEKRQAHRRAMKLMKSIGVSDKVKLTEYELCIASDLVDPLGMVVSWENIGGLEGTINEILETVILPFHDNTLVSNSSLVQPPKGVLLYGPPGCGKTMIAKATAKAAGARFVNLQVSTLVDKWYGESQKRVEAVFSLAVKLQPTIIFIDEIDSFMRTRNSTDHEATAMMKTQFMSFWDGLMTDTRCRVMIMGATNRPQDVDAAILRRMPSMFYVGLPELISREQILNLILSNEPVEDEVSMKKLAERTQGYSGSDLRELCRNAAIYRLREYSQRRRLARMQGDSSTNDVEEDTSRLRHISMEDFEKAFNKMKQSKFLTPVSMRFIDVE